MIKESLALRREVGDLHGIASCLNDLGNMEYREGDYPSARALHAESLEIRRQLGDLWGIAQSLNNLGNVEFSECDYPTAWTLYSESHAIRRNIGERFGIAASLNNLGNVEYCEGHYADAQALHAEGLGIKREIGDRIGASYSLNNLGNIGIKLGEYDAARQQLLEALVIARELGSKECMLPPLAIGTGLLALAGQHQAGAILRFGVRKQTEETGLALDPMDSGTLEEGWFILKKELASDEMEELRQAAGRMSLDELVEFALKELGDLKIPEDPGQ
jgi:tetratricopeptide (TPR) repeat protein